MRLDSRTLASLAICAAAAGASIAHTAIDILGDYILPHDSYDDVGHGSRALVSGLALLVALVLASRGLRACCDIALRDRLSPPRATGAYRGMLIFVLATVAATCLLVPFMELFDGRLEGVPVESVAAAFGGSIALGLSTTAFLAGLFATLVYGFAAWLVAHRDSIATIIATLLRATGNAARSRALDLDRSVLTLRRCRAPISLGLSRRGPPVPMLR